MNAAARPSEDDLKHAQTMPYELEAYGWSVMLDVLYRVDYPSVWHRGRGLDPEISLLSVTYEDGPDRKAFPSLPGLHEAIVTTIEREELSGADD